MRLRCYCCAAPLNGPTIVMVSYTKDADRVFLFREACMDRVDRTAFSQVVSISVPKFKKGFLRKRRS